MLTLVSAEVTVKIPVITVTQLATTEAHVKIINAGAMMTTQDLIHTDIGVLTVRLKSVLDDMHPAPIMVSALMVLVNVPMMAGLVFTVMNQTAQEHQIVLVMVAVTS